MNGRLVVVAGRISRHGSTIGIILGSLTTIVGALVTIAEAVTSKGDDNKE